MIFLRFIKLIHIHPVLIFFICISFLTGTFIQLFIMLFIVFIHEIGHFIAAKYYQWRVSAIVMWVFGGVMKTEDSTNHPIKEDIIVTVAGPVQHICIFIIISVVSIIGIFPSSIIQLAHYYNIIILFFNLLPIYPLDGGKLLLYVLSYLLPFRKAHRITILFSIVTCTLILLLQLFVWSFTLSSFLLIIFLLLENRSEWMNHYYIFIRFLLHRFTMKKKCMPIEPIYISDNNRLIELFSLFRRNRIHDIHIIGHDIKLSEKESLHLYFIEKKHSETLSELVGRT